MTLFAASLAIAVSAVFITRTILQRRIASRQRLSGSHHVDNSAYWPIGGIPQAVRLRGADDRNPLILYVHGGPGMPAMPFAHAFQRAWERDFTVVHWDQRNTGRTLTRNGLQTGLSLDHHVSDGLELAKLLRAHFPDVPLLLLGHSWGTAVALQMLKADPKMFDGYLAIGQVSDFLPAERYGYETVLAEAKRRNATKLIQLLSRYPDYPLNGTLTPASLTAVRKAELELGFGHHADRFVMLNLLRLAFVSPDYSWLDLLALFNLKAQKISLDLALSELPKFISQAKGAKVHCPIVMVGGGFDLFTPTPMARALFDTLEAPAKTFIEAKTLGHFGPIEDPDFFTSILKTRLKT
jgi:pimeloyl-ACP methyl ester carboxylesterase